MCIRDRHRGAVPCRGLGELDAELAGLRRDRGHQPGHVQDLDALGAEEAFEVELVDGQLPTDLAGAVVPHPGATGAVAGVGDVELVPQLSLIHI